jgi:hypothetical protein
VWATVEVVDTLLGVRYRVQGWDGNTIKYSDILTADRAREKLAEFGITNPDEHIEAAWRTRSEKSS